MMSDPDFSGGAFDESLEVEEVEAISITNDKLNQELLGFQDKVSQFLEFFKANDK